MTLKTYSLLDYITRTNRYLLVAIRVVRHGKKIGSRLFVFSLIFVRSNGYAATERREEEPGQYGRTVSEMISCAISRFNGSRQPRL